SAAVSSPARTVNASTSSSATAAVAVPTVSHSPQRYAAAAITNTKNRKNGPRCAVANIEISTGHTMSAACTTRRKALVDCGRKRNSNITTTACTKYTVSSQYSQREYTNPRTGPIQRVSTAAIVSATRADASQRSVRRISPALSGARKRHRSRYRGMIIQDKRLRSEERRVGKE